MTARYNKRKRAQYRDRSAARKLAATTYPNSKPAKGFTNRTEIEDKLQRIKERDKVKRSKRNTDTSTSTDNFTNSLTTNYDAFLDERKLVYEKPNKTKFERPIKRYKQHGNK